VGQEVTNRTTEWFLLFSLKDIRSEFHMRNGMIIFGLKNQLYGNE